MNPAQAEAAAIKRPRTPVVIARARVFGSELQSKLLGVLVNVVAAVATGVALTETSYISKVWNSLRCAKSGGSGGALQVLKTYLAYL